MMVRPYQDSFRAQKWEGIRKNRKGCPIGKQLLRKCFPGAAKKTHTGPCIHVLRRPDHISSFHQNLASSMWYYLHRHHGRHKREAVPRF